MNDAIEKMCEAHWNSRRTKPTLLWAARPDDEKEVLRQDMRAAVLALADHLSDLDFALVETAQKAMVTGEDSNAVRTVERNIIVANFLRALTSDTK
jgi:hypothetical protein